MNLLEKIMLTLHLDVNFDNQIDLFDSLMSSKELPIDFWELLMIQVCFVWILYLLVS